MIMPGSKSATTTSSRQHRYDPGTDFSYKFATRTFSRQGKRPATSPARIKHTAFGRKKTIFPEDMITMAKSPSPALQETYGGSLLMLRSGTDKVQPAKFLQLQKLINQPQLSPLASPRSAVPTPRFVKAMIDRAKTAEVLSKYSKYQSKGTQYDFSSHLSKPSASTTRTQFTGIQPRCRQISLTFVQHSDSWETRDPQSSLSFSKTEEFSERCVRCSSYPDIQIEGHSLSRILTNSNVLMAKEHCEVLGTRSCPDCIRVRSQRQHENHCSKNTPAVANDVYKIALVHERSPQLTKREVQRKFFDGEISDKILNFPYWDQNSSLLVTDYEHNKEFDLGRYQENQFLPNIHSVEDAKHKLSAKAPRSQNHNTFETIYEASENETESEVDDKRSISSRTGLVESNKTKEMVYQKHSAEKLQKIQVVPASETAAPVTDIDPIGNVQIPQKVISRNDLQHGANVAKLKELEKIDSSNQTELTPSLSAPVAPRSRLTQRCFTVNVAPSRNFFFDIADLAGRLRNSGVIRTKAQNINQGFQMIDVHRYPPSVPAENLQDKLETDSNASTDSTKPIKDFNMSYEPPVFSNYKGGYLGLNSATSRTSSSVV